MTNSRADDTASTPTPLTIPDSGRRGRTKRRRTLIAGAVAVVVAAGAATWWALAANSGDASRSGTRRRSPQAFGGYTEAEDGDTLWTSLAPVNTDIARPVAVQPPRGSTYA